MTVAMMLDGAPDYHWTVHVTKMLMSYYDAERSRGKLKSPLLLVKCLQRSVLSRGGFARNYCHRARRIKVGAF